MKRALLVAVLAVIPFSGFAKETKGIEGLKQYDCNVVSASGKLEQVNPIGKTVLAQSKEQATALYLMRIDANMVSRQLYVSAQDVRQGSNGELISDSLKEVSCQLLN
jgi:hypothetical protein